MKYLIPLLILAASPAFGQITSPDKASQDMCNTEWQISDKAGSTEDDISRIVKNAMKNFKSMGYSYSDFGIDENDYEKVSIQGADGFRKMIKGMKTYTYADGKDMFKERMMSVCLKNVMARLQKDKGM
ncbi:hypothetical protein [Ewingella americana]|uniref:Uncharacterized protein n=1 Tax=Ewingella americana TaxID=41202 RepID=A0A502GJV7_9GAMM|nr:hypothetical protein [Ewingella americana]TPG62577.1 hypothetical protein EAH77_08790 [Ewingella americana]